MKKLRLDFDDLIVESFSTQAPRARGTALGFESDSEIGPLGCGGTFHPEYTCADICQGQTELAFCTQGCDTGGNTEDPVATCVSYGIQCLPTHYLNDTCNPTAGECYC
jgi:hypothetical protein